MIYYQLGNRKPPKMLFIANWKMYQSRQSAVAYLQTLTQASLPSRVYVAPPLIWLTELADLSANHPTLGLAGQNCHWQEQGAYTGEISPVMLKEAGAEAVIIGHSERRLYYQETDEQVDQKTAAALRAGLTPICCIGENRDQDPKTILSKQLAGIIAASKPYPDRPPVIAYEPRWAIGTGQTPSPNDLQALIGFIVQILGQREWPIVYGGSTHPDNAAEFAALPRLDGLLVGKASLDLEVFLALIDNFAQRRREMLSAKR